MKVRPRGKSWQLDLGKINGKRVQLSFATKGEAEAEKRLREAALKRGGEMAFAISDAERVKILDMKARLEEAGATLEEAVDFFLLHARPRKGDVTLWTLIRDCLDAKEEQGRRPRYLSQLKCSAMSFARYVGEETICSHVTGPMIQRWLGVNDWEVKTQQVYRGDLSTVCSWGIEEGYLTKNPCADVKIAAGKNDDDEGLDDHIETLTVTEVERMLRRAAAVPANALQTDLRPLLAYLVIGVFCGLRPEREIGLLDWSDVKLESKVIIVTKGRAKTRARRVVPLSDNALAWLALCPVREGRVTPVGFDRLWAILRTECGFAVTWAQREKLRPWPHNGMRHTFATMHLEKYGDEQRLQLLMGHTSAAMLYANYKGLALPKDAEAFWQLRP